MNIEEENLETEISELENKNKELRLKNKKLTRISNKYKKNIGFYLKAKLYLELQWVTFVVGICVFLVISSGLYIFHTLGSYIKNSTLLSAQIACAPDNIGNYSIFSNNVLCESNGKYRSSTRK